jgi:hypothetical protein
MLARSDDIEMRAQELYVSPKQIRVSYRFYNAAPNDLKTVIAFPMPDVTVGDAAVSVPLPSDDPENLLGFSTLVDGVPVKARAVQKAFVRGMDRTADLERMKVPLAPHLRSTDKALAKLLPGDGDELTRNGLTAVEEYSVGRGMRKQLSPRWTLKTTYLWEQTFPAGKEVTVEHRYKPSVGRSVHTALGDPAAMNDERTKAYVRKYCIGQEVMEVLARARQAARTPYGAPFSEERISYMLSTDASRGRPMGEFRLTVDAGDQGSLVSFCADDARKTGPSRYEVRKAGFLPQGDLDILILRRSKGR